MTKFGLGYKLSCTNQWKEIDQNDLMDSKLRCVFAMPAGQVGKLLKTD